MLTTQNCGKYLSGDWQRERKQVQRDASLYTASDQSFYEVTGSCPGDGDGDRVLETFTMDTEPIEKESTSKRYDWRDKPEVGY